MLMNFLKYLIIIVTSHLINKIIKGSVAQNKV